MGFPEGISADPGSVWDELRTENPFCPAPKADLPKPGRDTPEPARFSPHGYGNM